MIRNLRLHRWRYPQCLMNAAEIVIHEVKSYRVFKILDLL